MPLGPGDRIFTDSGGRAEIQIGRTYIRMEGGTDISIVEVTPWNVSIGVAQGAVHVHNYGLLPEQALHVNTPSGSATLNSPGELRVDVYADQPAALFTEYSNGAFLTGAGGFSSDLPAGNALELVGSNPVTPEWMQPADPEPFDSWSRERDQQIARSISYRYVSSDIGGAYELDANGDWMPNSPYGAVWFPRVDRDWAPYRNGHWVNHAPWGSVWVEDEPWGYAPFHYGRWVVFNGRWGWVPGPVEAHPVWSPALVVFAGGAGGGVSAWFPLGPGEPYRPWYPCSPRYVDQVNITNLRPAPGIRIQASYAGFNFRAAVFANRSSGFSAMRQEDFAAGRRVRESNVVINRTVINNITIIERPVVEVDRRVIVTRAPARPVPVAAVRPAFINEHGLNVSARVGFRSAPPPVRPAPEVRTLPGHRMVAPPAGVRTTAPNSAAGAPGRPGQVDTPNPHTTVHSMPAPQQPTEVTPGGRPAVNGGGNPNQGAPNQGPHPGSARPPELTAKPAPRPEAEPAPRPTPKAEGEQPGRPVAPAPRPETAPAPRPAPNPPARATEPKPGPNQKPADKPQDKNNKDKPKKDHPDDKN